MLDRLSLSKQNGWIDENGRNYIAAPRNELANFLGVNRLGTISCYIKELIEIGLIEKSP